MRLVRCYIENFGNLHQYKLSFSNQITCIFEDNGFGKSTLAAFIRIMFYGMPRTTKSLDKNERKRYKPWQGGIYGGYLEFEYESELYRIERSFGLTPKEDEFHLYTLSPLLNSERFTEKIGEELFGVDANTFEKTIYRAQNASKFFTKSDLAQERERLLQTAEERKVYENAIQKLKAERSYLLAYRGKAGQLYELSSQIAQLEINLQHSKAAKESLSCRKKELIDAEQAFYETQSRISKLELQSHAPVEDIHNLHSREEQLSAYKQKLQGQLTSILEKFPKGLPSSQEITQLSIALGQVQHTQCNTSEQEEFRHLKDYFEESGVPTEDELHQLNTIQTKMTQISSKLKHSTLQRSRLGIPIFLIVFSFLLITSITGVFYFFSKENSQLLTVSFVIAVIASVLCVISAIRLLIEKTKQNRLEKQIAAFKSELFNLEIKARRILQNYFDDSLSVQPAIDMLSEMCQRYYELSEKRTYSSDTSDFVKSILEKYDIHITAFNTNVVHRLSVLSQSYYQLKKQIEQVDQLMIQTVSQEKKSSTESISTKADIEKLKVQANELRIKISGLQKTIAELQVQSDQYADIEDRLSDKVSLRDELSKKVRIIDKTIEHLQTAQSLLRDKFTLPIAKQLETYLIEALDLEKGSVNLDENLNIHLERNGMQREASYFSEGELDLADLCMRFAIKDVVFDGSSCIMILDDPFINLDQNHFNKAKSLLNKISESHQILYLTCHPSRVIE